MRKISLGKSIFFILLISAAALCFKDADELNTIKEQDVKASTHWDSSDIAINGKATTSTSGAHTLPYIPSLYQDMHRMANTLVVSEEDDDYFAHLQITKEKIDEAIIRADLLSLGDREKILEILKRWRNNDFSRAVEDHNYVCGNSQKATEAKPGKIY